MIRFSKTSLRKLVCCVITLALASATTSDIALASSSEKKPETPTSSDCTLNYATFEASIPHINLEHCPGGESSDEVFCRAKTGHDEIVVFKFSAKGDQCLLSTKSYDEDHFNLTIFDLVVNDD